MHVFVIDENVIRNAAETALKYEKLSAAYELFSLIVTNDHRIAHDPPLRRNYSTHFQKIANELVGRTNDPTDSVIRIIHMIMRDYSIIDTDDSPRLPQEIENALPRKDRQESGQDDVIVARVAVRHAATISTFDAEFRERVNKFITPRYPDVEALFPSDALRRYAT